MRFFFPITSSPFSEADGTMIGGGGWSQSEFLAHSLETVAARSSGGEPWGARLSLIQVERFHALLGFRPSIHSLWNNRLYSCEFRHMEDSHGRNGHKLEEFFSDGTCACLPAAWPLEVKLEEAGWKERGLCGPWFPLGVWHYLVWASGVERLHAPPFLFNNTNEASHSRQLLLPRTSDHLADSTHTHVPHT